MLTLQGLYELTLTAKRNRVPTAQGIYIVPADIQIFQVEEMTIRSYSSEPEKQGRVSEG